MLRFLLGVTGTDRIQNEDIRMTIPIEQFGDTVGERSQWRFMDVLNADGWSDRAGC